MDRKEPEVRFAAVAMIFLGAYVLAWLPAMMLLWAMDVWIQPRCTGVAATVAGYAWRLGCRVRAPRARPWRSVRCSWAVPASRPGSSATWPAPGGDQGPMLGIFITGPLRTSWARAWGCGTRGGAGDSGRDPRCKLLGSARGGPRGSLSPNTRTGRTHDPDRLRCRPTWLDRPLARRRRARRQQAPGPRRPVPAADGRGLARELVAVGGELHRDRPAHRAAAADQEPARRRVAHGLHVEDGRYVHELPAARRGAGGDARPRRRRAHGIHQRGAARRDVGHAARAADPGR